MSFLSFCHPGPQTLPPPRLQCKQTAEGARKHLFMEETQLKSPDLETNWQCGHVAECRQATEMQISGTNQIHDPSRKLQRSLFPLNKFMFKHPRRQLSWASRLKVTRSRTCHTDLRRFWSSVVQTKKRFVLSTWFWTYGDSPFSCKDYCFNKVRVLLPDNTGQFYSQATIKILWNSDIVMLGPDIVIKHWLVQVGLS